MKSNLNQLGAKNDEHLCIHGVRQNMRLSLRFNFIPSYRLFKGQIKDGVVFQSPEK